jgi:hypothetical protein
VSRHIDVQDAAGRGRHHPDDGLIAPGPSTMFVDRIIEMSLKIPGESRRPGLARIGPLSREHEMQEQTQVTALPFLRGGTDLHLKLAMLLDLPVEPIGNIFKGGAPLQYSFAWRLGGPILLSLWPSVLPN